MIQSDGEVPIAKRIKKTFNVYLELRGSFGSNNKTILGEIS